MPNVQYVNRLVEYNEEEPIGSAVPAAEKQFTNGFAKRSAFWGQGTTLRAARKTLRTPTRAANPIAGRTRRLAAYVAISCSEIGLGLGSDDNAVIHLA